MPITITQNFRQFPTKLLNAETLRQMGLLAREAIVRRTAAGKDKDGAPFAPYSEGYAKAKREALGTGGTPDLQVSGRMLNDMQVAEVQVNAEGSKGHVTIGFTS